jgi:hypothetical protein
VHRWIISDASRSCSRCQRSTLTTSRASAAIVAEIEHSGFEVVKARKLEDAEIAVQTDAATGCMAVDWGKKGPEGKTRR